MSIFRRSDYGGKKENPMKGHWSKKTGIRKPTQVKTNPIYCRNCNLKVTKWTKICSQCGGTRFQKTKRK